MNAAEKLTGSGKTILRISAMDDGQAVQLLRNKLASDIYDESAVKELSCALDYIPLALNQAAAYINRRSPRVTVRRMETNFAAAARNEKEASYGAIRETFDGTPTCPTRSR